MVWRIVNVAAGQEQPKSLFEHILGTPYVEREKVPRFMSMPTVSAREQAPIVGQEIETLRERVKELTRHIDTLSNKNADLERRNHNQWTLLGSRTDQINALERKNQELQSRVDKLQRQRRILRKEVHKYQLMHERDIALFKGNYNPEKTKYAFQSDDAVRALANEQQKNEHLLGLLHQARRERDEAQNKLGIIRKELG